MEDLTMRLKTYLDGHNEFASTLVMLAENIPDRGVGGCRYIYNKRTHSKYVADGAWSTGIERRRFADCRIVGSCPAADTNGRDCPVRQDLEKFLELVSALSESQYSGESADIAKVLMPSVEDYAKRADTG